MKLSTLAPPFVVVVTMATAAFALAPSSSTIEPRHLEVGITSAKDDVLGCLLEYHERIPTDVHMLVSIATDDRGDVSAVGIESGPYHDALRYCTSVAFGRVRFSAGAASREFVIEIRFVDGKLATFRRKP